MSETKSEKSQVSHIKLRGGPAGKAIFELQATADGGLLVLTGQNPEEGRTFLHKYDSAAKPAHEFGGDGLLELPVSQYGRISIVDQEEKFLLVRGSDSTEQFRGLSVSRYSIHTGKKDEGFGQGGTFSYKINDLFYVYPAYDKELHKLYVVLSIRQPYRISVLCITRDGKIDTDFGQNGLVEIQMPEGASSIIRHVSVRKNGHLLICFDGREKEGRSLHCRQLNRDGGLDVAFGSEGSVKKVLGDGELHVFVDDSESIKYVVTTAGTVCVRGLKANGQDDLDFGSIRAPANFSDTETQWLNPISHGVGDDYRIVHTSVYRPSHSSLPGWVHQVDEKGQLDTGFYDGGRYELEHRGGWSAIVAVPSRFPGSNDLFVAVSDSVYWFRR